MKGLTKRITLDELTKGNIWTLNESDLNQMLIEGKKHEEYIENEAHYMNIIRPVFDIVYLNRDDEKKVAALEAQHYEVFSAPNEGENNAIAIRKRQIKKITDLTLENIHHFEPYEVLELIEKNLGTGWKGLPLAIQDIIESAFYVDCSVLPAYAMHRAGGVIDRRKADGYDVLELTRGGWIEAIFIKAKPRIEKVRYEPTASSEDNYDKDEEDNDEDDDSDDMDDLKDDMDDNTEDEDNELDGEIEEDAKFEDIDNIDVVDIDEDDEE